MIHSRKYLLQTDFNECYWKYRKKMLKLLCIKIAYRRTYPSRDCTLCLKKTCDYVFDNKVIVRLQQFSAYLLPGGSTIDTCFPHLTYLMYLLYFGNCQDQNNISKKIKQNHENFTWRCDSDKSLSVKAVWCTKAVEWIAWHGLATWKHRQSAEENLQDGYNCPATRQR